MHISGHETIGLPIVSQSGTAESQKIAPHTPSTDCANLDASSCRSETVELSSQGKEVQRIQRLVQQTPEIREQRVAAATRAIEQGTLTLKGSDLADAILSDPLHITLSRS